MIALLSLASFSTLAFGSKTDHSNLVMTDGRWSSKAQAPTPVPEVELLRYSGRWYQVYSDLASNTFVSVLGLGAFFKCIHLVGNAPFFARFFFFKIPHLVGNAPFFVHFFFKIPPLTAFPPCTIYPPGN